MPKDHVLAEIPLTNFAKLSYTYDRTDLLGFYL